jgi:hypothetical protein
MGRWSATLLAIVQVIYVDMRKAKLSCYKIYGVVYFGFTSNTDTGAFAIVNKSFFMTQMCAGPRSTSFRSEVNWVSHSLITDIIVKKPSLCLSVCLSLSTNMAAASPQSVLSNRVCNNVIRI